MRRIPWMKDNSRDPTVACAPSRMTAWDRCFKKYMPIGNNTIIVPAHCHSELMRRISWIDCTLWNPSACDLRMTGGTYIFINNVSPSNYDCHSERMRRIPLLSAFLRYPSVSPCRPSLKDDKLGSSFFFTHSVNTTHHLSFWALAKNLPIQKIPYKLLHNVILITCDFLSLLINISSTINIQDVNDNLIINNFENCPVFSNS